MSTHTITRTGITEDQFTLILCCGDRTPVEFVRATFPSTVSLERTDEWINTQMRIHMAEKHPEDGGEQEIPATMDSHPFRPQFTITTVLTVGMYFGQCWLSRNLMVFETPVAFATPEEAVRVTEEMLLKRIAQVLR